VPTFSIQLSIFYKEGFLFADKKNKVSTVLPKEVTIPYNQSQAHHIVWSFCFPSACFSINIKSEAKKKNEPQQCEKSKSIRTPDNRKKA
jgi:hypothetical protein